jgi:hypothetical protein
MKELHLLNNESLESCELEGWMLIAAVFQDFIKFQSKPI